MIFLIIAASMVCNAQQPIKNMYLLRNLNDHSQNGQYSACWGYIAGGREYALLGCADGTSFVDITDSTDIHEVDFIAGPVSCCREMKTFGQWAYITADGVSSGLQIIDLSYLPDSVSLVRTFYFPGFTRAHTISQSGPYLYLNAGDYLSGGIFILDISINPTSPVKRGEWETHVVHDCRVVNDIIWACNIYSPPGTISVIDASDKDNLTTIASWVNNPQPGPHNIALTADGKYALVTDEINGFPRRLKIWNVEDLNSVYFVSDWHPPGIDSSIIHNVEVYGNYAIAAHYTAGIRVINISNPNIPVEEAWYDTYPQGNRFTFNGCWGVYMFPSGKIIASDRETGLYVLRTTFALTGAQTVPGGFSLKQNFPNPFNQSTLIEFEIPKSSHAALKVYDITGKLLATLVDGFTEYGKHAVTFSPAGFASAVYFYKLEAEDLSESRKMVLVK